MAPNPVTEAGFSKNLSVSGLVVTGPGDSVGVLCNSCSGGATVSLYDGKDTGGEKVTNGTVLTPGQFFACPRRFVTGWYASISGTADITVFASPNKQ